MGIPELADLVRAGLAADQEAAQWASAGPWWVEDGEPLRWGDQRDSEVACSKGTVAVLAYDRNGALNADHIVRLADPARVLVEVAAKRQLLDQVLAWPHRRNSDNDWYSCSQARDEDGDWACANESRAGEPCDCGRDERVYAVLQLIAQPYRETDRG